MKMKLIFYFLIFSLILLCLFTQTNNFQIENVNSLRKNSHNLKNNLIAGKITSNNQQIDNFFAAESQPSNSGLDDLNTVSPKKISRIYQGICFVKIHGWIHDLNNISWNDDHTYLVRSKQGNYIDFNLCGDISTYCYNKLERGLVVDKHTCTRYAGAWNEDKIWTKISINSLS